jgi:hypothetical protein
MVMVISKTKGLLGNYVFFPLLPVCVKEYLSYSAKFPYNSVLTDLCVYQWTACKKNSPVIHVILIDQRSQCRFIHPITQITERNRTDTPETQVRLVSC